MMRPAQVVWAVIGSIAVVLVFLVVISMASVPAGPAQFTQADIAGTWVCECDSSATLEFREDGTFSATEIPYDVLSASSGSSIIREFRSGEVYDGAGEWGVHLGIGPSGGDQLWAIFHSGDLERVGNLNLLVDGDSGDQKVVIADPELVSRFYFSQSS